MSENTMPVWLMEEAECSDLHDPVNHPPHYTSHPSGIECIQITEHMGFNHFRMRVQLCEILL